MNNSKEKWVHCLYVVSSFHVDLSDSFQVLSPCELWLYLDSVILGNVNWCYFWKQWNTYNRLSWRWYCSHDTWSLTILYDSLVLFHEMFNRFIWFFAYLISISICIYISVIIWLRYRLLKNSISDNIIHISITATFQKKIKILFPLIIKRMWCLNTDIHNITIWAIF